MDAREQFGEHEKCVNFSLFDVGLFLKKERVNVLVFVG